MRLALVVLVACTSQPAYTPSLPTAVCPAAATPAAVAAPAAPPPEPERAGVLREELERLDREIDALDNEIATFAPPTAKREAALVDTIEREQAVSRASVDGNLTGATTAMRQIAALFAAKQLQQLELEQNHGPRMPAVIAGHREIEWLRTAFEAQRAAELVEIYGLRAAYSELRSGARPVEVRNAGLRAEIAAFVSDARTGYEPSDAPAALRIAVDHLFDSRRRIAVAGEELGPKHPEMMAATAEGDQAREDLESAVKATTDVMLAQIAAPLAATAKVDPTKIMRRVELAARARELRAELAAL